MLATVAVIALALSELSPFLSASLWLLAVGLTLAELNTVQPVRLRWSSEGVLCLDWADGREEVQVLLGVRLLGSLCVLHLCAGERRWCLPIWPGQLSDAERKALRRRLGGGHGALDTR